MGGACNFHGNVRNECKISVRKPHTNRLSERLWCRLEDTIKTDHNIKI